MAALLATDVGCAFGAARVSDTMILSDVVITGLLRRIGMVAE